MLKDMKNAVANQDFEAQPNPRNHSNIACRTKCHSASKQRYTILCR